MSCVTTFLKYLELIFTILLAVSRLALKVLV